MALRLPQIPKKTGGLIPKKPAEYRALSIYNKKVTFQLVQCGFAFCKLVFEFRYNTNLSEIFGHLLDVSNEFLEIVLIK